MLSLEEEQDRLELRSVERGKARAQAQLDADLSNGRLGSAGMRVVRDSIRRTTAGIRQLQAEVQRSVEDGWDGRPGRNPAFRLSILALQPEVLAHISVNILLSSAHAERRVQSLSIAIARAIEDTLWLSEVPALESARLRAAEYDRTQSRIPYLRQALERRGPRAIQRWRKLLDDLPTTQHSSRDRVHIGSPILGVALECLSDIVTVADEGIGNRSRLIVRVRPTFIQELRESADRLGILQPALVPMVCPPVDWSTSGRGMVGGYRHIRMDGLKKGPDAHTRPEDISQTHIDAMNRLQAVAWRVNDFVLRNARKAFDSDLGPLTYQPEVPLPDRIPEGEWSAMTEDEQADTRNSRRLAHTHNHRSNSHKLAAMRALDVAGEFAGRRIWFPHSMDYRGRFYPLPQDLHPQGPDMVRALLTLDRAVPLGKRGVMWLEYAAASAYGLDKSSRTDQGLWTNLHLTRILRVGQDPWLDLEFWGEADEPWQFAAVCRELWCAHQWPAGPEKYPSSLPVHIDGTCNGLQHLSAMSRDEVGGEAVNLTPGPRRDIYQIVADRVTDRLPPDSQWTGRVDRRVVKRAVMTTPYGVTPRGIADQLMTDGWTSGMDSPRQAAAELRDAIVLGVSETITRGSEVMAWLQACAEVLVLYDAGISWETPSGMVVRQEYRASTETRVRTAMGMVSVRNPSKPNDKLRRYKMTNAIAPNVIHSFDAAHLAMVIGGTAFDVAAVHDSYGTQAAHVDELLDVTKRQFVEIYNTDWFTKLKASFEFLGPKGTRVPPHPQMGTLDTAGVLDSDFFFA